MLVEQYATAASLENDLTVPQNVKHGSLPHNPAVSQIGTEEK